MDRMLTILNQNNADVACAIYNENTLQGEQYYQILTRDQFTGLFLTPSKEGDRIFAAYGPQMTGFVIGHFDSVLKRYFLTMIGVRRPYRRQGIGTMLLNWLQQEVNKDAEREGLGMPSLEISYCDPAEITWVLPGTPGHIHPNAPGVLLGSPAHLFFKNRGFLDFAYQNSYHLDLKSYQWPQEKMKPYLEKMAARGYTIEFYDPAKHKDMQGLVDDLNNDLWNTQIPVEMNRPGGPRPTLIVNDHGRVGGFAGPIVVEDSGRGWLLGLLIHSRCRKAGCATVLFNRMCEEFRKAGAQYMTIFTTENNPARAIYESAGFSIHASWADMRRKAGSCG
ncbi:MAG TPA: hypothetical protein DEP00_05780 [Lachnospiraceae bacterium]|nr:hypothetical protein [Lachnospiraceae bacterium]